MKQPMSPFDQIYRAHSPTESIRMEADHNDKKRTSILYHKQPREEIYKTLERTVKNIRGPKLTAMVRFEAYAREVGEINLCKIEDLVAMYAYDKRNHSYEHGSLINAIYNRWEGLYQGINYNPSEADLTAFKKIKGLKPKQKASKDLLRKITQHYANKARSQANTQHGVNRYQQEEITRTKTLAGEEVVRQAFYRSASAPERQRALNLIHQKVDDLVRRKRPGNSTQPPRIAKIAITEVWLQDEQLQALGGCDCRQRNYQHIFI